MFYLIQPKKKKAIEASRKSMIDLDKSGRGRESSSN
jgi:hypothetical protein